MSWSASLGATKATDIDAAIDGCATSPPEDGLDEEVVEQVNAARAAAKGLVASGAVGDSEKAFTVTLSGHSNEGHEPADGWANDCVTVTIAQVAAPAAEESDEE